jgi:hypothetical protein
MSQNDQPKKVGVTIAIAAAIGLGIVTLVSIPFGIKAFVGYRTKASMTRNWGLDPKNTDRVYKLLQAELTPTFEGPTFRAFAERRLEAQKKQDPSVNPFEFGRELGRTLVARGTARLSDDSLGTFHELKGKMAVASKRACACLWDPRSCTEADIFDGLAKLSDEDLSTWFKLSARAAELEMDASNPVPETTKDLQEGLVAIVRGLPEGDKTHFVEILQAKAAVPKHEQCYAMKTVYQGSESLSPEAKSRFLRALSNVKPSSRESP